MKFLLTIFSFLAYVNTFAQEYIKIANDCYDKKDYPCAIENYKQAISLKKYQEKDWAEINYRIGVSTSNEKKYGESITYYKEALKSKPEWEYINYSIGWNYQQLKDHPLAIEYYTKSIPYYQNSATQKKTVATVYHAISSSFFDQKKYTETIATCEKALMVDPEHYLANHQIGDAYFNLDKYEDAIKYYDRAIQVGTDKKETLSDAYRFRGRAKNELFKYAGALEDAKKALEIDLSNDYVNWDIAIVYHNQKKYDSAVLYFEKTIDIFKADNNNKNLKEIYAGYAKSLNSNIQYSKAILAIDKAIAIDNKIDTYHAINGDIQYNAGYYTSSANAYEKAIQLAPPTIAKKTLAYRYRWLGKSFAKNYKYKEAINQYKKSLELEPNAKGTIWDHAAALYNLSKYNDAIKEYTKCIPLYKEKDEIKSLTELYYWRSYSYFNLKQFDKALLDINEALKINPDSTDGLLQKGKTLVEQKKYKEAIPVFTKAIDISKVKYKYYDGILYQRGRCYLFIKDTANAISDFKDAVAKNSYLKGPAVELGNIYFARKQYSTAYTQYNSGFAGFTPDTALLATLHFRKGFCNRMQGYTYSAKTDFLQSVKLDSTNKEAQRYLAESYYHEKSYDLALKHFTTCIKLYKNVKDSLHKMYAYRGLVYSQQKKYKEALTEYELAEKNKPNDAGYLTDIGRIAFELKEYQKAINAFKKTIPLYKATEKNELAFAYYAKGRCESELKNNVQAKADIKKAVEILPTYKEAKDWLDKNK